MWRSLRIRSLCGEYRSSFRGTDTGGKKRRRSGTGISGNPRRSGRVHSFAVGSSSAIYIAQCLKLEYAVSAGTIVLLTLLMTKWETVKVSIIPSSYVSGFDCCILDHLLAYREDLDCLWIVHIYHRFFSELAGWRATISVNSVVGAHFLVSRDFSFYSVCNELILALIGITAALLLNLFYDYNGSKKSIIANMCYRRTSSR